MNLADFVSVSSCVEEADMDPETCDKLSLLEAKIESIKCEIKKLRDEQKLLENEREQITQKQKMLITKQSSERFKNSTFEWSEKIRKISREEFHIGERKTSSLYR